MRISSLIQKSLSLFLDKRDLPNFPISHITLLLGCAFPFLIGSETICFGNNDSNKEGQDLNELK